VWRHRGGRSRSQSLAWRARTSSLSSGRMARWCSGRLPSVSLTCSEKLRAQSAAMMSSSLIWSASQRPRTIFLPTATSRSADVRAVGAVRSRVPTAAAGVAACLRGDASDVHRGASGRPADISARAARQAGPGERRCLGDHVRAGRPRNVRREWQKVTVQPVPDSGQLSGNRRSGATVSGNRPAQNGRKKLAILALNPQCFRAPETGPIGSGAAGAVASRKTICTPAGVDEQRDRSRAAEDDADANSRERPATRGRRAYSPIRGTVDRRAASSGSS